MNLLWILIPVFLAIIIFGWIMLYGIKMLNSDSNKPRWLGAVIIGLTWLASYAFIEAFEEKRAVAAFAEGLVAYTLYYGIPVVSAVAGYFTGRKMYKITTKKWIGWAIGILIGLFIFLPLHILSSEIPGVGWRMEKISEDSENVDYDYAR